MDTSFVVLIDLDQNWLGQNTKVLHKIHDHNSLELIIHQLQRYTKSKIFLSISGTKNLEKVETLQTKFKDIVFHFSKYSDEVPRLQEAIKTLESDTIVRIKADNPIIGTELIEEGLKSLEKFDLAVTWGFPVGINLEFYRSKLISDIDLVDFHKRPKELFISEKQDKVNIQRIQPTNSKLLRPELRWTTGSDRDFLFIKKLLEKPKEFISTSLLEWINYSNELLIELPQSPVMLNIEPTNKCNLKCVMCPRDQMTRPLGTMSIQDYKKLMIQAQDAGVTEITLNGYGEPFITQEVYEMVSLAKEFGFNIKINTNGHYLTEDRIIKLLQDPPHVLSISLDGATKEVYERVRINGDFSKVQKAISLFIKLRKEQNKEHEVKLNLQIIKMDETQEEVDEFCNFWKDKVDEVHVPNVHNWGGVIQKNGVLNDLDITRYPCKELFRTMMVFYDGNVSICCAVFDDNMNLGNIHEQPLIDIWNNSEYQLLRKHHINGDFHKIDVCKDCNMWKVYG
ncbi:MAG: radical SAM protein [Candidatus Cloacimonetes bacterium]|nr:radical SAM protein [Candidatus Cloacimonadota bacterium]